VTESTSLRCFKNVGTGATEAKFRSRATGNGQTLPLTAAFSQGISGQPLETGGRASPRCFVATMGPSCGGTRRILAYQSN